MKSIYVNEVSLHVPVVETTLPTGQSIKYQIQMDGD